MCLHLSDVCEVGALYFRVRKYILFEQFDVHGLDMQALIAEGRFYSDMELTEQEIERMVMEASRAEFLAGESFRLQSPWQEETSTSAGAEPSSSGTSKNFTLLL
jgi:hypothetical protein